MQKLETRIAQGNLSVVVLEHETGRREEKEGAMTRDELHRPALL